MVLEDCREILRLLGTDPVVQKVEAGDCLQVPYGIVEATPAHGSRDVLAGRSVMLQLASCP